ncbi:MAG TPA: methyltransferase domain-containing protein, partial [Polyangiaceae bacterium]|nr:methyltransferase domain-containing protein [Polyangiaceae bacterium]
MNSSKATDAPNAAGGSDAKFDEYAAEYDRLLEQSISASGEGKEYFLEYKLACLKRLGIGADAAILDYGCGVGNLTGHLSGFYPKVAGYDPSAQSLALARKRHARAEFYDRVEAIPNRAFDA